MKASFLQSGLVVLGLIVVGIARPAEAGPIGPGGFGGTEVVDTFQDFPGFAQFPGPLIRSGVSYNSEDGMMRRFVSLPASLCFGGGAISNDSGLIGGFVEATLDVPAFRVGGWTSRASNPGPTSTLVEFYNADDVLLGVVDTGTYVDTPLFAGWEDPAGIKRIRFVATVQPGLILLDNFTTEVPEPTTLGMLACGLACVLGRRAESKRERSRY